MLFNSLRFAIFFVTVYSFYLFLNHKWQNRMLLVASYVFYGAWDWRFLSLIITLTLLNYICGIKIGESQHIGRRKLFLFFSAFGSLSILAFFKYFNFFVHSLAQTLGYFGLPMNLGSLNIILPMGISFYTFQTMSYTIDIYRKEIKPTRRFLDFALFVSFFPQLVAGPIERAKNLLPQVLNVRTFRLDQFYEGCYLIFWGLFQKMYVADNLAKLVDPVFEGPPYEGGKVILALYAFAFQIFCDFAGYSNIARGIGKLMGFDIMVNFRLPYFATNPREFWDRWHISLSSWLRDYLYIPLGGSRKGNWKTYRNLIITMLLGGLWHGAKWTFVLWGAYHGLLLMIHRAFSPLVRRPNHTAGRLWLTLRIVLFFHLVCLGWLFFRANNAGQAFHMLSSLSSGFGSWYGKIPLKVFAYSILLLIIQGIQYRKNDLLAVLKLKPLYQIMLYLAILYSILLLGVTSNEEFIYFQF